jgi:hypothetical protein
MLGESGNNVWRWARVALDELLCPTCEGDARLKGVEGQAAFVVCGGAGEGQEGCGDETACCLRSVSMGY